VLFSVILRSPIRGKKGAPMFRLKIFELPDDCLGRSSRGVKVLKHRNIRNYLHTPI
jgi:hypothetical protein